MPPNIYYTLWAWSWTKTLDWKVVTSLSISRYLASDTIYKENRGRTAPHWFNEDAFQSSTLDALFMFLDTRVFTEARARRQTLSICYTWSCCKHAPHANDKIATVGAISRIRLRTCLASRYTWLLSSLRLLDSSTGFRWNVVWNLKSPH